MKRYPTRNLTVPEGFVLSDEEIIATLENANERKRLGDPGFLTQDAADGYTLFIPSSVSIRRDEIIVCLSKLNEAKENGHADVLFTFHNSELVKKHVTLKADGPSPNGRLFIGGAPGPRQF